MNERMCKQVEVLTLQGRGHGGGQSEVVVDSGTDPSAVQGAPTLMGPERTAGLGTHSHAL